MPTVPSWPAAASEQYADAVRHTAQRLRHLADEVERVGLRQDSPGAYRATSGPHSVTAQRVVHSVMWGLANASLDRVVRAAAEADYAAREGDDT